MADDQQVAEDHRQEFGIDDTLNFQIVTLSNKLSLTVARRALAADNLTLREWRIMMVVFIFGPSMAREISEKALLDPAHVSRTVHTMEKAGLVRFDSNLRDRRQIIVHLTDKGAALTRNVLPKAVAVNDAFRSIYSDKEFATLISLLSRANEHAEKLLNSDMLSVDGES